MSSSYRVNVGTTKHDRLLRCYYSICPSYTFTVTSAQIVDVAGWYLYIGQVEYTGRPCLKHSDRFLTGVNVCTKVRLIYNISLLLDSTLKMEAASVFEMFVALYQSRLRLLTEDVNLRVKINSHPLTHYVTPTRINKYFIAVQGKSVVILRIIRNLQTRLWMKFEYFLY